MTYTLVIQQILNGVPTDLIREVSEYGPLNLSYCLEWRDAFIARAEAVGDTIITAQCFLRETNHD